MRKKSRYGSIAPTNKWKRKRNQKLAIAGGILLIILLTVLGVLQFQSYRKEAAFRETGIVQFQQKKYDEAQKSFENALEYQNVFGKNLTQDIRYYLAETQFLQGNYEKALNLYQEISRKEKSKGIAECYIGACYAKLGDTKKAEHAFQEGVELGNEEAYHYLSKMYYDLEDYEKALEYEKEFMKKREPDGTSYMVLAKSYMGNGDYKKALQAIKKGIALDDHELQSLLFQEIVIYEKKLDFETAYEKCLVYVKEYPDDEAAKKELEFLETR